MEGRLRKSTPRKRIPALTLEEGDMPYRNFLTRDELGRTQDSDWLEAFSKLTDREREVLLARYAIVATGLTNLKREEPAATLHDIGQELGISTTRSWNLENSAMSKLRRSLISRVRPQDEDE